MIYNNHLPSPSIPTAARFERAIRIQSERAGMTGLIALIEAMRPGPDGPEIFAGGSDPGPRRQALLNRRPDL
jgi:hypothetical protein